MDPQAQQLRRNEGPKRPPLYEIGKEGHFGSCQQLANQGQAPDPDIYTGPWTNINQGLHGTYREILSTYWQGSLRRLEDDDHDYKAQQLPIARIKKVMKADPEVKMISAEAPILFAKGCELFITELTMRAWIHAEENKRRTLQRSDIAAALTKSDMFDFLIDIVPREEAGASHSRRPAAHSAPPPPMPQQQPVQQQAPPPQHHPAPHDYAPYIPAEQEYRSSAMYGAQVPPDQAPYGHPQAPMFDQSMYAGYPMAPQQMYQMPPQRPQEPPVGPPQGHHYRPHEGGGGDADAEGERDYDVD